MKNQSPFFAALWVLICSAVWIVEAAEPVKIVRFDRQMFDAIETKSSDSIDKLYRLYPRFVPIYVDEVIKQSRESIVPFFSNAQLHRLYTDALSRFTDVSDLEKQLGEAFDRLRQQGIASTLPTVYLHVSGLNQSMVVGEGFVSISIDKYMGADYPFYSHYLYDYQYRQMIPSKILPDCLRAWLYSEYPFGLKEKNLLEYMMYEGRIFALLEKALPAQTLAAAFGYTPQEWAWVEKNEKQVYEYMVRNNQLSSRDPALIARYINEGPPSTFLSPDAPDRLGLYVGWKIARAWNIQHPQASPAQTMEREALSLLEEANYKP